MAPLSSSSVVILAAIMMTFQSGFWSVQADCPDYISNAGCNTGSCTSGGLLTNFLAPDTDFPCVNGKCPTSKSVTFGGINVVLCREKTPAKCCFRCKSSDQCNVWQWLQTEDGALCYIYSQVPFLVCGANYTTNVGSKCSIPGSPKFPPPAPLSPPSPPLPPIEPGCPQYNISECNSPSCGPEGIPGNFSVPAKIPCSVESCPFSGVWSKDGKLIYIEASKSPADCSDMCAKSKKCKVWQFLKTKKSGACFMYPEGLGPECGSTYNTTVGIKCSLVCHDPHFVGAHGTHYDFNGEPGKSFCLVSDLRLHMNMKMTGYLDDRTESASLLVGGKAVRTWIRELGILWRVEGKEHSLLLAAREGKETARGEGFLAKAEVDGEVLERMEVGEEVEMAGGLTIRFVAIKKKGIFDVDAYSVRIAGLLDLTVQLRVAHPLLQRPDDAEAHISLGINWMQSTPAIHGVLGQTYREGREERTEIFSKMTAELQHAISADGKSGHGFLDGRPEDYISSDVLKADCRYSGFSGRNLPAFVE